MSQRLTYLIGDLDEAIEHLEEAEICSIQLSGHRVNDETGEVITPGDLYYLSLADAIKDVRKGVEMIRANPDLKDRAGEM